MPTATLPVQGISFVTDGGLETDLIFHHGVDLPDFAAFPLLDTSAGRELLTGYYADYAAIAGRVGAGLLLETPTWRASADWGLRLGYDAADLDRLNTDAITMLHGLRAQYGTAIDTVLVGGSVGPRGDGYSADHQLTPADAAEYHRPQLQAFAAAGADLATAYTLTHIGEAIGVVEAARSVGIAIAVSFTVETDGRLPSGDTLGAAIAAVDQAAHPDHFLINCAHPEHIRHALAEPGSWRERIAGIRVNASVRSHAELDSAEELDEGDIAALASSHRELTRALPAVTIVGGCCGTDARHVAALWGTDLPAANS